ncbi:hypothetical protein OF83DRAFT_308253 [Amylostereum chailletii]|nr:hypothetical protein OF83DRAFT_308253 [Amylostereum chailletii]
MFFLLRPRAFAPRASAPLLRPAFLRGSSRNFAWSLPRRSQPPPTEIPNAFREIPKFPPPPKSLLHDLDFPATGRHILFAVAGSLLAFGIAAYNTNVVTDFWFKYLSTPSNFPGGNILGAMLPPPTTGNMRMARASVMIKKFQEKVDALQQDIASYPILVKSVIIHSYARVAEAWLNASDGRRAAWGICAVNGLVWFAWQIPRLKPFMHMHFAHDPLSGRSYTMLTSMFSHASFIHLLFNCMTLSSLAATTSAWMTREQAYASSRVQEADATYHFLAFYLSAGLISSLISHLVTTRIIWPRLIHKLITNPPKPGPQPAPTSTRLMSSARAPAVAGAEGGGALTEGRILPSLGASGAIYGAVVLAALAFPEAEVSLIFPPTPAFPIQYGVGGLVLLDMVGAWRGWRLFDHYAHMGGAAFGAAYYMCGMKWWDACRSSLARDKAGTRKEERG